MARSSDASSSASGRRKACALDISKIEAGKLDVERIPCSPHQIIAEIVSVLRARALEKGLTLEYHWSSGIPELIRTDGVRLAHGLKGTAGTLGYPAFTAPAAELERLALRRQTAAIEQALTKVVRLAERVRIPTAEPVESNG